MKPVKNIVKDTADFFDINIIDYALMSNVATVKIGAKSQSMNFFEIYCEIRKDYDSVSFIADPHFKKLYQNFYKMTKLQVSSGFISEYFEILEDSKIWVSGWDWRTKYHEIAKRLEPYSEGKFQLSFISKLLHTVDIFLNIY